MSDRPADRSGDRSLVAVPRVIAHHDAALVARLVRRVPMRYADGADPARDRPAHVRAGSGIALVDARVAVAQDDASFVALVDPATGLAEAVTLPAGEGGLRQFDDARGNKAHKLDLEAMAAVARADDTLLVAFGSGSTPRRESVVLLPVARGVPLAPRVERVPGFYAGLRATPSFAGSELNVEGAIWLGDRLRLFQRGNGAARDGRVPVDATCDVGWPALLAHLEAPDAAPPPAPSDVVQYDLGAIRGTRLTFTDAALASAHDGRRTILYTATAEASPDAVRDGDVAGSAIGVIVERDGELHARWAELCDDGGPLALKVEGLAPEPSDPSRLLVVVDVDVHDWPSELCEVRLEGPWL